MAIPMKKRADIHIESARSYGFRIDNLYDIFLNGRYIGRVDTFQKRFIPLRGQGYLFERYLKYKVEIERAIKYYNENLK